MNRLYRTRRYNSRTMQYDILFPQTVTSNILRRDNGGVLETYLNWYDNHLGNALPHINHAVSTGTYRHLEARIHGRTLTDGFPLMLRLHTNLEIDPTLDFNNSGPKPIITANGEPIPGGQCEGASLFLVWSEPLDSWILMSNYNFRDITRVMLPIERDYTYIGEFDGQQTIIIPDFNYNTDKLKINYGQTILRPGLDYNFDPRTPSAVNLLNFSIQKGDLVFFTITKYETVAKKGTFKYDLQWTDYPVTIEFDDTTEINLPVEALTAHAIEINHGQTILRNELDYSISDDGTQILLNYPLMKGDVVVIRLEQFIETNGEVNPNNWGATGNYRYSLKIDHEEYTCTKDNVTIVPVPNYNRRKDELNVIRDNHLLVFDVDYTIDPLNQVVLLNSHLDSGDCLYFTILRGAMLDTPNFNVIDASGDSGQHIHVDISHDLLCNFYTLLVRLKYPLESAPTVKCIDGDAEAICDCFGCPVIGGYKAGAYLWLVYNEDERCWYSLSHSQMDVTSNYPVYRVDEGVANFTGGSPLAPDYDPNLLGETIIAHKLGAKPLRINIQPIEPPTISTDTGLRTTIGDIWYYADEEHLYVGNTGLSTSKFHWMVSMETNSTDLTTYVDEKIDEVNSDISDTVTELRTTDNSLKESVTQLDATDTAIKTAIDNIYNDIGDLQNQDTLLHTADTDLRTYLERQIAEVKARPGNLVTNLVVYTAESDGVRDITVENYRPYIDKLVVNYGQTILREGIDYNITETGIYLTTLELMTDDILQFMIITQNEDTV